MARDNTKTYQCANCHTFYQDTPGRYGPPIPHPKSECLPLIRQQYSDAAEALRDARERLVRAENSVYA